MENYKKKAIELMAGLAITEKKSPAVIPYLPAKIAASGKERRDLPRKIAGPSGKYARELTLLLRELEAERRVNLHSIMLIKDGEVICEASHPGYDVNTYHLAHSMSKTVTALAVGILCDEGKLKTDEKIIDIFPEMPFCDPRFADITVDDLLTMKSGVPFAEIGTVTTDKWTDTFFDSELTAAPGEEFKYNSMNSYILAKIVTRIAKCRLSDYLRKRLFAPLGIKNYLWELSPEGCEKGGFGLYLSCESFAKLGLLILNGGEYNGKQIISLEFIERMTATHALANDEKLGFDYGYQIWTKLESSDVLMNGMLGQNVLISPSNNMVISINAGNNELFCDSPTLDTIKRHIGNFTEDSHSTKKEIKEFYSLLDNFFTRRHWIRPLKKVRTLRNLFGLFGSEPFDENFNDVLGTYAFPDNNSGILPIFVSVFQNNYMGGIEKITLEERDGKLLLTSVEGGVAYEVPVGLYGYEESILNFRGERYIVRAYGEAMEDEDRNPVYKIELIFPELPNTRMIKITHAPEGIKLRLCETPNQKVAESFLSGFTEGGKLGFAMGLLEKKVGADFLSTKLTALFNAELIGIDTRIEGWESIIDSVNRELEKKRESSNKIVKNLINRFVGDDAEEEVKEEKPKGSGFLAKAFSALISKFSPSGASSENEKSAQSKEDAEKSDKQKKN